jgi:manganese oxidase
MGETGMAEMSDMAEMMAMPLPENTLPMMTGTGQFGAINMGGMFTLLKVRDNIAKNSNADPGHYQQPKGTQAYELADNAALPAATKEPQAQSTGVEFNVQKPNHKGMEH